MKKITEIRWHGRGGQGAKTAALLFGEVQAIGSKFRCVEKPANRAVELGAGHHDGVCLTELAWAKFEM